MRHIPLNVAVRIAMAVDLRSEYRALCSSVKRETLKEDLHRPLLVMASTLERGQKLDASTYGMRSYVDMCVRTCQDFGCSVEETEQILDEMFENRGES